jgi:hypothetical protein
LIFLRTNVSRFADALTEENPVKTTDAESRTVKATFMLKEIVILFNDDSKALLWKALVFKKPAIKRMAPFPSPVVMSATTIVRVESDTLTCTIGDSCPTAPFSKTKLKI